jgi:hypothetical protein
MTGPTGITGPSTFNSYTVSPVYTGSFSIPNSVSATGYYNYYQISTSSSSITVTLPEISTLMDNDLKRQHSIADIGGNLSTNPFTIQTSGSDTIAGDSSLEINVDYSSITIASNTSSAWLIL